MDGITQLDRRVTQTEHDVRDNRDAIARVGAMINTENVAHMQRYQEVQLQVQRIEGDIRTLNTSMNEGFNRLNSLVTRLLWIVSVGFALVSLLAAQEGGLSAIVATLKMIGS